MNTCSKSFFHLLFNLSVADGLRSARLIYIIIFQHYTVISLQILFLVYQKILKYAILFFILSKFIQLKCLILPKNLHFTIIEKISIYMDTVF